MTNSIKIGSCTMHSIAVKAAQMSQIIFTSMKYHLKSSSCMTARTRFHTQERSHTGQDLSVKNEDFWWPPLTYSTQHNIKTVRYHRPLHAKLAEGSFFSHPRESLNRCMSSQHGRSSSSGQWLQLELWLTGSASPNITSKWPSTGHL